MCIILWRIRALIAKANIRTMPMILSQDDLRAMVRCLDSVRDDVGYAERILAESNAKITQIWAYIQLSLSKAHEDNVRLKCRLPNPY